MEIPRTIYRLGDHACFGYRVLAKSFQDLEEIFTVATQLCGESEVLPCPTWSTPTCLNPDQDPTRSSFILPSPSGASAKVVVEGDYVGSDAEEEVIARVLRQTAVNAGTSVSLDHSLSSHLANHSWFIPPTQQPGAAKRPRSISPGTSKDFVPVLFPICIIQPTYQPHR